MTISQLPLPDSTAREHITLPVDGLAAALAKAEEVGYNRALTDARVSDMERNRLVTNHWGSYETRVTLYAAIWRGKMMEPAR